MKNEQKKRKKYEKITSLTLFETAKYLLPMSDDSRTYFWLIVYLQVAYMYTYYVYYIILLFLRLV